ncbi:MAG: hypothetical protein HRT43_12945 [Campylobacteraceae bacterium]|nr:hypothetical protein [Campylobacteraceae bacterium]
MSEIIEFHKKYIHYKNGLSYMPIDKCKIQEDDIWVDAIIYKTQSQELFVRSKKEFIKKFAKE